MRAKIINHKRRHYGHVGDVETKAAGGCVVRFDDGTEGWFCWHEVRVVG